MAFLDNSGDIILDAVLTDEGRRRLARADGSFKISNFSLGDVEVDYGLFNKNHPSGSAYEDLQILQTPVLEAFTSSPGQLDAKLITYLDSSKFYLPVIMVNDLESSNSRMVSTQVFGVAVTKTSRDSFASIDGIMDGYSPDASKSHIQLDQGLDTEVLTPEMGISADAIETQYIVQMDNRLGTITNPNGSAAAVSFIDGDDIATYYLTRPANPTIVKLNTNIAVSALTEIITGPRGTTMQFKIKSSMNVRQSKFLFEQIGAQTTLNDSAGSSQNIRYIDTTIKVTGATTGYAVDVPVRFIRLKSED
jgi:hypothetical protein